MAETVAQLVGYLDIDDDRWNAKMRSAEGDVKRSSGWLSGLAGVAKGVGLGLVGIGGAAGIMGLKTAAGLQNAEIAFTTMLGSGEKAKAFLDDLKDFAAKTPFEFPELQTAASSLVSAGFAAEDVIPIMTTLGDVTSGMGTGSEGIKRATVALQQMSAAGKITAEDLNQLRDAGVPVFDLLAAATGKSKAEIAEMAATGKLGKEEMQQLFDALEQGKGLERFTGLMDQQSKSLGGIFSTVKDSIQMGLADAIMPLVPILTTLLPKAAAIFSDALKWLSGVMKGVIDWVTRLGDSGESGLGRWGPAFAAVKKAAGSFWSSVGGIFDKIRAFWDKWGPVLVAWLQKNIPKAAAALGTAFAKIGDAIGKVIDFISEVIGWFQKHEGATDAVKAALAGLLAGFVAFKVVSGIIRGIAAAQAILNAVMAMNPIGLVVIAIVGLVAALVYAWKNSETFRDIVIGVWEAVKGAVMAVLHFFTQTIPQVWANVVQWTKDAWNGLVEWVTGLPAMFAEAASTLWNWVWEKAKEIYQNVLDAVVDFLTWVGDLPTTLATKAGEIWEFVKTKAGEILGNVLDALADFWEWLKDLPGLLAEKAGDVFGWFADAAKRAAQEASDWLASVGSGVLGGGWHVEVPGLPQGTDQRGTGSAGDGSRGFGSDSTDGRMVQVVHNHWPPTVPLANAINSSESLFRLVGTA